jgi:hypothetical protein
VTVIVPTHDHADTIDLACRSILSQSIASLEMVVIGDGATPEVRAAIAPLLSDERVRFIDRPKSSSRGERVRHEVLTRATSTYVCYHGDDDIMLTDHLAATVERLQTVDFTHPLPVCIVAHGELRAHVTDLGDPRCRLWHQHPTRNAVSLTGVGLRLDAYRRLPYGWREPPPGRWSDHYMWQQWFTAEPCFRFATGDHPTVLKFDASQRPGMTGAQRRDEILDWLERSRQPGFDDWLAAQAAAAFRRAATDLRMDRDHHADQLDRERRAFTEERDAFVRDREERVIREADLRAARQRSEDQASVAASALRDIEASRVWRTRNRLVSVPPFRWLSRA